MTSAKITLITHSVSVTADAVRLTTTTNPSLATTLTVASLDAPILGIGEPWPFPVRESEQPEGAPQFSYNLYNNIWGTNYPQWYPFEGVYGYGKHGDRTLGTDASFRFELEF